MENKSTKAGKVAVALMMMYALGGLVVTLVWVTR